MFLKETNLTMPKIPPQLPIIPPNREEYTGQGQGDGNKWTCGARLIQAPCVVYSFGSNNNMQLPRMVAGGWLSP